MSTTPTHHRAEIWWIAAEEAGEGGQAEDKERPVVIISQDDLNRGNRVVVIPFYSQQIEKRRARKEWAFVAARAGGFHRDSIGNAANIQAIPRLELLHRTGRLNAAEMETLMNAVRFMMRDTRP